MKEQFVTYDIALKLKESGFDEPCFSLYVIDTKKLKLGDFSSDEDFSGQHFNSQSLGVVSAPLWQQLIYWCLTKLESTNEEPYNRKWTIEYDINRKGAIDFGYGDYCFEFDNFEQLFYKVIELRINK